MGLNTQKYCDRVRSTVESSLDEPNAETIEALKESRKVKLESYKTLEAFWEAMGMDPDCDSE